ncbi:MAG: T9SS type A sorting domain-containing protein, partial [Panacibacter sp.]
PLQLGNISNLGYVNLSGNQLKGNIPPEIGNLTNLTHLYISSNQLSGEIPSEIGKMIKLEELYLDFNQLSGDIPPEIGNLINLQYLRLNLNHLSGYIPPEIGNLKNLKDLYLTGNKLKGEIPSEMGSLSNLEVLNLVGNQLSGSIPSELGNLFNLTDLQLESNNLSGGIPAELGSLSNLEVLYLDHNQLSGSIPASLGMLYNLRLFFLDNNQLSGTVPASLNGYTYLEYGIFISFNRFTFDGIEALVDDYLIYSPQANIPIHQNNNYLYVSVGGTLSNNTYKWFMVGAPDSTTITGDSVFYPSQNGKYFAKVTNSICTQLTLYTDTVEYSSVLPVSIVNLKAQQQGNIIKVDWSSLTEINVGSYEIQRSLNGRDFSTIGSVVAKNNGASQTSYTFNDLQPAIGNNYYRLKVIDGDGKKTYSNIVSLNVNSNKTITLVYPVPARDVLHIQTNGNGFFSLIDQSGKILLIQNIIGNGTINISGIASGFYYLKNNTNSTLQKVIISR